jgi:hypothetical protein
MKGGFYQHVQWLSSAVVPSQKYRGKTLGVEASMLIHKWIRRDPEACLGRQDFLKMQYLFQRFAVDTHGLGIGLHFVFDGEDCPNKAAEAAARAQRREAAEADYIRTGDQQALEKACRVSSDMPGMPGRAVNSGWCALRSLLSPQVCLAVAATGAPCNCCCALLPVPLVQLVAAAPVTCCCCSRHVVTDCCWVSESEVKVSIELEAHLFRLD